MKKEIKIISIVIIVFSIIIAISSINYNSYLKKIKKEIAREYISNTLDDEDETYIKKDNQSSNNIQKEEGASYNGYSYQERKEQCNKTWGNSWCYEINRRYNCVSLGHYHYNNCKCVSSCK